MNDPSTSWNPEAPGLKVRLRDNPGRQGTTTGRTRTAGTFVMVEVDFGPNEKQFKRHELLELVIEGKELFDLLAAGTFGGPSRGGNEQRNAIAGWNGAPTGTQAFVIQVSDGRGDAGCEAASGRLRRCCASALKRIAVG